VSQSVLRMPRLSDSMSEATIVAWLKQPGERFVRGEPLFEVETDKATVVYEAEGDGLLADILVSEGGTAALGEPVARLGVAYGDEATAATTHDVLEEQSDRMQPTAAAPVSVRAQPARGQRARATPVARRTAVQLRVSLQGLAGTGPGGRIRKLDVLHAEPAGPTPEIHGLKGSMTAVELSTTGATIARRMAQSRSEIPSFDVVVEVDMSVIVELRRNATDVVERAPSINDFVVKAAARALREYPAFNSSFVSGRCERHGRVNVGVAVATDNSLLVPAIIDADLKPLATIAAETRELAARAQSGQLAPEELTAATFTISNLGMFGVYSFTAVINPPQVAILAVGAVKRAPVESTTGSVIFRDLVTLTLTADHRAIYGADAARFLGRLRQLLEQPLGLFL
jgi:pyruvate dehydrogenase E2 component (dihydrolipoamide acetyltransferase)